MLIQAVMTNIYYRSIRDALIVKFKRRETARGIEN